MGTSPRKEERYTYKDYRTWNDDERWELIDGVAWAMSPAPATNHQRVSMRLANIFFNFLQDKPCEVFAAPFDVRLDEPFDNNDPSTVVQPDLVVICDKSRIDENGCKGAPDLVVEILSPASMARDESEKLALYQRHNVREYWIVNLRDRSIKTYRLAGDRQFHPPKLFVTGEKAPVSVLPGCTVDVDTVFRE